MKNNRSQRYARYLITGITLLALSALPGPSRQALASGAAWELATQAQQTPGCPSAMTPSLTEGPYYKAGSPERTSLIEQGMGGTKVVITGYVLDRNCNPVSHAWLDFWQADANGVYDNTGYRMRGHQYTDQSGRYSLETVVPGEYPGRTVHIHVKVQAPNGPIVTSQLFFPGVARNQTDSIFNPALVVNIQETPSGKTGTFNFRLDVTAPQAPQSPPTGSGYTFKETGLAVSGDFWTAWQGGRSYQEALYINGLPITSVRDETSPTDGKVYKTQWFERARFEAHPLNQPPYNMLLGLLGVAAAQGRQNEAAFKPVGNPGGAVQWFPETQHTLGDSSEGGRAIAAFWARLGGLKQFGFPISQPFMEASKEDGKTYLVQYFERQRFEYHPENKGTRFEVLLGRLGAEQVKK